MQKCHSEYDENIFVFMQKLMCLCEQKEYHNDYDENF